MASSGNFLTMNPLNKDTVALLSGNCKLNMATNQRGALGNIEIPLTGKWYFECFAQMGSGVEGYVGVSDIETDLTSSRGGITDSTMYGFGFSQYSGSNYFAIKVDGGTADNSGRIDTGSTNNAVLGIAVNRDDNEIKLYTNNTLRFTIAISATTLYFPFFGVGGANNANYFMYLNAGQDSTFGGNKTAGENADGNGFGDFFYSPPSNHIALCSANLPIDSGLDPAQTDDDPPVKLFGMLSYTGNAGANSVTGLGFKPDLVWGLNRSASQSKRVLDSSRGGNNYVYLDSASAQVAGSASGDTVEFLDDGIKWNNANGNNDNTVTYAAACWRANGGTTASNTSGTITTTVQTDPPQSFSIVTYTGTGSNATIGHGLSAAPNCVFIKNLSQADSWIVYNSGGLLGNSKFIRVDLNLGSNVTGTSYMQDTSPSSTVISLGNAHNVNASTEDYVAYCWRDTDGFQKFGTFKGNADNDGAFVYTGFRPVVVLLAPLRFSGTPHWGFHNTVSNSGFNPSSNIIDLDDEYAEYQSAGRAIDVLSNGFKARTSDAAINSTAGMAYFCWGDVPFKYGNQF